MSAIQSLTISGIRGIRAPLTLALAGKSLLLRGDNGTGKSSIVQALRLALTGRATSRNAPVLAPENVRHRLETDPSALRVTVDLSGASRIIVEGDAVTFEGEGAAFRAACARANPFLRREELVAVVRDLPGERFKYFQSFLDLELVDELCESLNKEAKRRNDDLKLRKRSRDDLLQQARSTLSGAPLAGSVEVTRAAGVAARAAGVPIASECSWADIQRLMATATAGALSPEALLRRQHLVTAGESARQLVPPAHPMTVLKPLHEAEARAHESYLLNLLTQALQSVKAHDHGGRCPVCEQTVEREALVQSLQERVGVLEDVKRLSASATSLATSWREFLDALEKLERTANCTIDEPAARLTGRVLLDQLAANEDDLSVLILRRLDTLRTTLDSQVASSPDAASAIKLRDLDAAIRSLTPVVERLETIEGELTILEAQLAVLKAIEKSVGDARKAVAAEILDGIGSIVARFYEAIHPSSALDEPTGPPTVEVQRHRGGTAFLRGKFAGQAIDDPQQLYSDGHLDTIGICIFLALRRSRADRERHNDPKLMVLDDIIMSIDMGHSKRLVELLRDEFRDHQILLFSHNELFMHICRRPLGYAKRLDINRWSLEDGPRLVPHVCDVEHLRSALRDSGDQIQIASAMRVLLDEFLIEAANALEVSLRSGSRPLTVSDYWGPLRKKLREVRKDIAGELEPIFQRIGEPEFFRNALGAHVNDWAREAELRQIQEVSQALLDLIDALSCAGCHAVLRPRVPNDLGAGLVCECAKGLAPTQKKICQNGASGRVEGA